MCVTTWRKVKTSSDSVFNEFLLLRYKVVWLEVVENLHTFISMYELWALIKTWVGTSNQLIFIGLRSSKHYYKRPGGSLGIWEGSLGCGLLHVLMCAEGVACASRWVRWVFWLTGTTSGHPGVPWKISPRMRWLSQSEMCSKIAPNKKIVRLPHNRYTLFAFLDWG